MATEAGTTTISFDFSEEDFDAFQIYFLTNSTFNRKRTRLWQVVSGFFGSLLPLAMGILLLSRIEPADAMVIEILAGVAIAWGIGYGLFVLFFLANHSRKSTLRRLKKFYAAHNVDLGYGERTLRIVGDSLECDWPRGRSEMAIAKMIEPAETELHVFSFMDEAQAFIVPKKKVRHGDVSTFVAEFRRAHAGR